MNENEFDGAPPSGSGSSRPYPRIKEFVSVYANGSGDDQRSAQSFCDCEANETIESLRSELISVSSGNFNPNTFDLLVGKGRIGKYGSYDNWAKLVLQWIANYRRM